MGGGGQGYCTGKDGEKNTNPELDWWEGQYASQLQLLRVGGGPLMRKNNSERTEAEAREGRSYETLFWTCQDSNAYKISQQSLGRRNRPWPT